MMDFKIDLISKLETAVPELKDKIQAGAVDTQTPVPYAAYSTIEETPIRTKSGIAGYLTTFDLSVYHNRMASAETLKHKIINALNGIEVGGRLCYFKSAEYGFYADYNIHGYVITFKII